MTPLIFIGWDPRELRAWNVAQMSLRTHASIETYVTRIAMPELQATGLYRRPTQCHTDGSYWDEISQAPMSTGHAIARFLVPTLCHFEGWALFLDGDVLWRADIAELWALRDQSKAVQVVQHDHRPDECYKMDGQVQTIYARKNWSSVMLFNCGHPSNRRLSDVLVNEVPGRDLHRFCWLEDHEIGALPPRWNWLVGHSEPLIDPAVVHFTTGVPDMPGYAHVDYADEWYDVARGCGYKLERPAKPEAA